MKRIFPPFIDVKVDEGFANGNDIFGRKKIADQMTSLLGRVNEPIVLALDGPWGSGKTTFLRQWQAELKREGYPVVYFDAFANDFHDDAFLPIASEIIALANSRMEATKGKLEKFRERTIDVGKFLLRSSARIALKGVTLNTLDLPDFEGVAAEEADKIFDHYVGDLLASHANTQSKMQLFRSALSELPLLLAEEKSEQAEQKPLILIVDELDRCRPTFSLQLLERVKHFFSVPNVHFVLGTNLEQLANSIAAAYGPNVNGREYLQKFIHLTINLQDVFDRQMQTTASVFLDRIRNAVALEGKDKEVLHDCIEELRRISEKKNLGLRTIEQLFSHIVRAIVSTPPNNFKNAVFLTGLAVLKVLEPALFRKAKSGSLRFSEVVGVLGLQDSGTSVQYAANSGSSYKRDWAQKFWRFSVDPDCPPEINREMQTLVVRNNFWSRESLVPYVANEQIDRFQSVEKR